MVHNHVVELFALSQFTASSEGAVLLQLVDRRRVGAVLIHVDYPRYRITGIRQKSLEGVNVLQCTGSISQHVVNRIPIVANARSNDDCVRCLQSAHATKSSAYRTRISSWPHRRPSRSSLFR